MAFRRVNGLSPKASRAERRYLGNAARATLFVTHGACASLKQTRPRCGGERPFALLSWSPSGRTPSHRQLLHTGGTAVRQVIKESRTEM